MSTLSLSSMVESVSPNRLSLIKIIDRIETDRISKMDSLKKFQPGKEVVYRNDVGIIVEVSNKLTSVVVDFRGRKKRFFINKRKGTKTINELRLR